MALDTVQLDTLPAETARGLAYRPARAGGSWDFQREIVVVARSHEGIPAVHVVTPLRLDTNRAVLVERGWVPAPDARGVDLARLREPDSGAVTGLLLEGSGRADDVGSGWPVYVRAVNPAVLAGRFPYDVLPVLLRRGVVGPSELRPIPPPELSDGPHLSYALQWFAFAIIAVTGSVILVVQHGRNHEGNGAPRPGEETA